MLRFFLSLFGLLLAANAVFGIEFTSLSKYQPVQMSYSTSEKTYVNFTLSLNSEQDPKPNLFLRVRYIIGSDTLNDYIYTDGEYEGLLKQVQLDRGETVTVGIFLNNAGQELAKGLDGILEMNKTDEPEIGSGLGKYYYPGSIWRHDDVTIFRINKSDSEPKSLVLKVIVSENYEFDKLFMRFKIISPMQGILELNKDLDVYSDAFLPYKGRTMEIKLPELHIDKPGNYYLQVSHEHVNKRINGVVSVAWELR